MSYMKLQNKIFWSNIFLWLGLQNVYSEWIWEIQYLFQGWWRGNFLNVIFQLVILLTTHKPPIFITYLLNTINYSISWRKSAIFSYLDFSICLPLKKNMAKQWGFFILSCRKMYNSINILNFSCSGGTIWW